MRTLFFVLLLASANVRAGSATTASGTLHCDFDSTKRVLTLRWESPSARAIVIQHSSAFFAAREGAPPGDTRIVEQAEIIEAGETRKFPVKADRAAVTAGAAGFETRFVVDGFDDQQGSCLV